ncbi:MAG: hypothetical protein AAGD05_18785, partial [Bacteroidota bacterium]
KSTLLQFEPIKAVMPPRDKVAATPPPTYDALFLMSPGDSLMTYMTVDTFRNYQRPGWLAPDDTLFYRLSLLSVRSKADIEAEKAALLAQKDEVVAATQKVITDYNTGTLKDQLQKTESGLQYVIHEPGEGEKVSEGRYVKVNYA